MINFNRSFGVHSSIKKEVKLLGPIYLIDAFILAGALGMISMGREFFTKAISPIPYIIWVCCWVFLSVYAIIRPRSNPEKRNYQLFLLSFSKTPSLYQSINTSDYEPISMIFNVNSNYVKRMALNGKYKGNQDVSGLFHRVKMKEK